MPKTIHRPEYDVVLAMVRSLRERAGITQTDMSAQLGRSQSFISDIERGVRRIDVLELRDICRLAGKGFPAFVGELEVAIAGAAAGRESRDAPSRAKARRKAKTAS
jgi:transcriptional regulator with XRE-family HTH domain